MARRGDPRWRDEAAAALMAGLLEPGFPVPSELREAGGPVLVVDDPRAEVKAALGGLGLSAHRWNRSDATTPGVAGAVAPAGDFFGGALLRLPRSRSSLEYALDVLVRVVAPGGLVAVYGAGDEGITSTPKRMEGPLDAVETVAKGKRCRVIVGRVPGAGSRTERQRPPSLHGDRPSATQGRAPSYTDVVASALERWRSHDTLEIAGESVPWVHYPGTFAKGGLDGGTALLLEHLPKLPAGSRVLDFGAGGGVLAAGVRRASPEAEILLVEPDALARAAARENVPGAVFVPLAEWTETEPLDAIVSNPPYHQGKVETLDVVAALAEGAAALLRPGGELRLVVQRRLPVKDLLQARFTEVTPVADSGPFRVWSARQER